MRPAPVRVLVASELRLMREVVGMALRGCGGFAVSLVDADLPSIVRAAQLTAPDALLLSPARQMRTLRHGARLSVVGDLRRALPHVPVVMLAPAPSADVARAVLDDGAFAYVLNDEGLVELADALLCAAEWRPYVGSVLQVLLDEAGVRPAALTLREADVLALIAHGRSNVEIAAALRLSVRSIEAARASAARTLGATTKAELIDAAIDLGLVL